MQRILLESTSCRHFFQTVTKNAVSMKKATVICGVSQRSIRDWARGKYRPPLEAIKTLAEMFEIAMPTIITTQEEADIKRIAGKKGALARLARYGNPGTEEGRRKGGNRAVLRLQRGDTKFVL